MNGQSNGRHNGANGNGGPTMKGIIGRTAGHHVNKDKQANVWSKLAFDYDLDKIIPKEEQLKPPSHRKGVKKDESELSVGSKFQNYDINSDYSYRARNSAPGSARKDAEKANEEESGLITSDSDFEMAAQTAGYKHENFSQAGPTTNHATGSKNPANLKKDVTRIFKGLLTKNRERGIKRRGGDDSTQYAGSDRKDFDS